jgi:protein SCO1/2
MSVGTKLLLSLLLLAGGAYVGYVGFRMWDRGRTEAELDPKRSLNQKPTRPLADFEFTERNGEKVKLSDLAGKIVVVNFFFANCPGSCRQFTTTIAGLQEEFKDAPDVRFVSVTVDPEKDTPDALSKYADQFHADKQRWWFVNAPMRETQELGRSLQVSVLGTTHTDEMVLLDRDGVIRGAYDHKDPQKLTKFKKDLRELLEAAPAAKRDAE